MSIEKFTAITNNLIASTQKKNYFLHILTQALKIIPAESGALYTFSADELRLKAAINSDHFPALLVKKTQLLKFCKTTNSELTELEMKFTPPLFKKQKVYCLRLYEDKKLIGVFLFIFAAPQAFSEEKQSEAELFGYIATLALRNYEFTQQIVEDMQVRDAFISMIVHELRTPLTTIHGYIQLLQRKLLASQQLEKDWVIQMKNESRRLMKLINELLDVHKLKANRLYFELKTCQVHELVNQALTETGHIFPNRELQLTKLSHPEIDTIVGDPERLVQLFTILFDNALKYSAPTSPVQVRLKCEPKIISIIVEDWGQGMTKAVLDHLFDEKYHVMTHNNQGVGFSLLIAKSIVEAHHGNLTVQSYVGKGTKVLVELPRLLLS